MCIPSGTISDYFPQVQTVLCLAIFPQDYLINKDFLTLPPLPPLKK